MESCEICQATKSSTQKPVGLVILLTVPQKPWIELASNFLFLKQLVVDGTKLIPGMRFSDTQKPHCVTFCKVLNIIDRHSVYTYIIPSTGEINAAGVIDIFEKHIKPTIGLLFSIVSDQDVAFMSVEFQDRMIKKSIRHKVSTTYHRGTDGQRGRKNRKLTAMLQYMSWKALIC